MFKPYCSRVKGSLALLKFRKTTARGVGDMRGFLGQDFEK